MADTPVIPPWVQPQWMSGALHLLPRCVLPLPYTTVKMDSQHWFGSPSVQLQQANSFVGKHKPLPNARWQKGNLNLRREKNNFIMLLTSGISLNILISLMPLRNRARATSSASVDHPPLAEELHYLIWFIIWIGPGCKLNKFFLHSCFYTEGSPPTSKTPKPWGSIPMVDAWFVCGPSHWLTFLSYPTPASISFTYLPIVSFLKSRKGVVSLHTEYVTQDFIISFTQQSPHWDLTKSHPTIKQSKQLIKQRFVSHVGTGEHQPVLGWISWGYFSTLPGSCSHT